ncbi:hypothetical protein MSAN_01038700 [Mycena sanguinolenta]|uniref:Uncharacterized protein n=1 Tax=Mycena sanguinolenta TaxID=230812 RepID=A0A8H7D9H4_9AGAR|nr:hypothetical protein MSAN_01038700 [Mycena sanguinolenta]
MDPILGIDYLEKLTHLYELRFSQYGPHLAAKLNASFVLPCFIALSLLLVFAFCSSRLAGRPISHHSDSIEALFTVLAPTSSRSKTISVSMTSLISTVCDGTVEIRNYGDLPDLFSETLLVYGWRVGLALDAMCNLEVLRWVVGSYFSWSLVLLGSLYPLHHIPLTSADRNQRGASSKRRPSLKRAHNASSPKPSSESLVSFSITPNAHLDLDYLPFSRLESSLLELRANLAPGAIATLEFTTSAPHVAFLSPHFTICAVPFLPRRYLRSAAKTDRIRARTATPLQASLHRILELLTAAGPGVALALENVSNVSKKYADGLNAAAEHLEEASATRAAFIRQWGEAGWREQRLMMGWEAALFSAGLLMRWVVVVRK